MTCSSDLQLLSLLVFIYLVLKKVTILQYIYILMAILITNNDDKLIKVNSQRIYTYIHISNYLKSLPV